MAISDIFDEAVVLYDLGTPFALIAAPGCNTPRLMVNPSSGQFSATSWLNVGCDAEPISVTTSRSDYIDAIDKTIGSVSLRGGKTVISRVIAGGDLTIDIARLARLQFKAYPQTMRFLFYRPETGLWLGSSPELLVRHSLASGEFMTAALAGTRDAIIEGPWDDKNRDEHRQVVQFVAERMAAMGLSFECRCMPDVIFPPVRHMLHTFKGHSTRAQAIELADALSPTPALAGFPRQEALADIARVESHQRRMYGGFISVGLDAETFESYVCLRCMQLSHTAFCLYTGSGVTSASTADDEWRETDNKAAMTLSNIRASIIYSH